MRSEIRVALISVAAAVAAVSASQASTQQIIDALDNEFVNVVIEPPRTTPPPSIADANSLTGHPFVRVYVPTHPVPPTPDAPRGTGLYSIFAMYFAKDRIYGNSGTMLGTFYHIDLKSLPGKSDFAADAVKLDPTHNEVLLENDRVRIVRIHFEPGESGPIVDKRTRVIIAVTDSHATVTFPDGHSEPRDMKGGTVSFGNAGRQATKNTGTTPLENIVVELKSKDLEKK